MTENAYVMVEFTTREEIPQGKRDMVILKTVASEKRMRAGTFGLGCSLRRRR